MMKLNIPNIFSNIVIHPNVWRFLGFGSSVVGFSCYALSPSFHHLFGHWNLLKIILYSLLALIFSLLMLFVNNLLLIFSRGFLMKTHVGFLALVLTSLYAFYDDDRSKQGGHDVEIKGSYNSILSLVSFGAFALMSMSLSRQIQPDFDLGMSNFFLGCFIVAIMKMNIKIALAVAALFHLLITIRSCVFSFLESSSNDVGDTENTVIEVIASQSEEEAEMMMIVSESHNEMPSLDNDGHQISDTSDDENENGDQETDYVIDTVDIVQSLWRGYQLLLSFVTSPSYC